MQIYKLIFKRNVVANKENCKKKVSSIPIRNKRDLCLVVKVYAVARLFCNSHLLSFLTKVIGTYSSFGAPI